MTSQLKTRLAEQLFDAMDSINDRYLDEAARWRDKPVVRPSRTRKSHAARNWLIAAAITLVVTMAVLPAVLQSGVGSGGENAESPDRSTLSACIREAVSKQALAPCTEDDIPFADGRTYVVVRDTASDRLYVSRSLSAEERRLVTKDLNTSSQQPVASGAAPDEFRIWIVNGDGTVTSPALKPSAGNVDMGCLFDYEPERLPSDAIRDLILRLSAS